MSCENGTLGYFRTKLASLNRKKGLQVPLGELPYWRMLLSFKPGVSPTQKPLID